MRSFARLWLPAVLLCLSACTCNKQPPPKETLKHEGEPCSTDDSCETGLCDGAPSFQPVCVRKCATGCLPDEVCTQLTPDRFACQPDQRRLCQHCEVDTDCPYPSDKCVVVNNENVCGRDCAFDQSCPNGYRCLNALGTDGTPKLEQCTPQNASCACLARGDFQQPCDVSNSFGTCHGVKQCDLVANTVVCDAKQPAAETCNGQDDNCDGHTDEGQPTVSCGVGACVRTVSSCADGGQATCVPGDAGVETCNSIDDDCDGTVDNGFNTSGDVANCGSCSHQCALAHATPACTGGQCVVQTCDTGWDNCNGVDSDGCEVSVLNDPMHCGSCSGVCSQQNSSAMCVGGVCQFTCNPGYVDLNRDPSDGCEYQCTFTSSVDLPDLAFVDANCDGIDGEVNNGIFVAPAPLGNDAFPGTRAQPKATVGAALIAVVTGGKRDVYLATGTYSGPMELNLSSNLNVAGGYDPVTWLRATTNLTQVQGGNPSLKIEGASNVLVQLMRFSGANGVAPDVTAYGGWVKDSSGVRLESLVVAAGNGAGGALGAAGTAGGPGVAGGVGTQGCVWDYRPGDFAVLCQLGFTVTACDSGARPPGGQAGSSACGYPGGGGGQPSHQDATDKSMNTVVNGGNGSAAPNGSGAAGLGVPFQTTPSGLPYYGGAGSGGVAGTNGGSAAGAVSANGWAPGHGADGTRGTDGRGGGGGGGGAGGWVPIFGDFGNPCQGWGSAGGGGGGGGCAGAGGLGGRGGGASIGLFVSASTIAGQGVVVNAGNGGNGGAGGTAGASGSGGAGGVSPVPNDSSQGTRGGNGGPGGNGGAGGVGGGGAGGSVYGLARSTASTVSGVTVGTLGTAGAGGAAPAAGPAGAHALQTTF